MFFANSIIDIFDVGDLKFFFLVAKKVGSTKIEPKKISKKVRKSLQKRSIKNFYLTHKFVSKCIDDYRSEKLFLNNTFYFKSKLRSLRILHVTNFNEDTLFGMRCNPSCVYAKDFILSD